MSEAASGTVVFPVEKEKGGEQPIRDLKASEETSSEGYVSVKNKVGVEKISPSRNSFDAGLRVCQQSQVHYRHVSERYLPSPCKLHPMLKAPCQNNRASTRSIRPGA